MLQGLLSWVLLQMHWIKQTNSEFQCHVEVFNDLLSVVDEKGPLAKPDDLREACVTAFKLCGGNGAKKEKGHPGTCMKDPWTNTRRGGLDVGGGGEEGGIE